MDDVIDLFCPNYSTANLSEVPTYNKSVELFHFFQTIKHAAYITQVVVGTIGFLLNLSLWVLLRYFFACKIIMWKHRFLVISIVSIDILCSIALLINASLHISKTSYSLQESTELTQSDYVCTLLAVYSPMAGRSCQSLLQCIAVRKPLFYRKYMTTRLSAVLGAINVLCIVLLVILIVLTTEDITAEEFFRYFRSGLFILLVILEIYLLVCLAIMGVTQILTNKVVLRRMGTREKKQVRRFKFIQ